MALGNIETVRVVWSINSFLLSHFYPGVSNKTEEVSLEKVSHVITDIVRLKILFNTSLLRAMVILKRCWWMNVLRLNIVKKTFIPHDKINVSIQITARHFISIWPFSLGREHNNVLKMSQFWSIYACKCLDITRMHTWTSRDKNSSCDDILICIDLIDPHHFCL